MCVCVWFAQWNEHGQRTPKSNKTTHHNRRRCRPCRSSRLTIAYHLYLIHFDRTHNRFAHWPIRSALVCALYAHIRVLHEFRINSINRVPENVFYFVSSVCARARSTNRQKKTCKVTNRNMDDSVLQQQIRSTTSRRIRSDNDIRMLRCDSSIVCCATTYNTLVCSPKRAQCWVVKPVFD